MKRVCLIAVSLAFGLVTSCSLVEEDASFDTRPYPSVNVYSKNTAATNQAVLLLKEKGYELNERGSVLVISSRGGRYGDLIGSWEGYYAPDDERWMGSPREGQVSSSIYEVVVDMRLSDIKTGRTLWTATARTKEDMAWQKYVDAEAVLTQKAVESAMENFPKYGEYPGKP